MKEANIVIDYLERMADEGRVVDMQNLFYLFTLDSFGEYVLLQSDSYHSFNVDS